MKKILSLVLSISMIITLASVCAFGANASEQAVYVSADGVIDGFSGKVYTDFSAAFSALGADGGTIYLEGVATLPATPDLSKMAGKTITFKGFNGAQGNVVQFRNAMKSFVPSGNVSLVFDDITVKHADGTTTEDWIFPSGGSITFGSGCLYEAGYRADRNQDLHMYIGSYQAAKGGTINFNAPNVVYAEVGSIAGYLGGQTSNFTTDGDVVYNFNAGTFSGGIFGGMRNSTTGFATLNGDVYYNFNGAKLPTGASLVTGNLKSGKINGNIFFTFNAGEINRTLKLGSDGDFTEDYCSYGNTVVTVNAKGLVESGKNVTLNIANGKNPQNRGKYFLIINNYEKLSESTKVSVSSTASVVDYNLQVVGGSLKPVFAKSSGSSIGAFLGFEAHPDTEGLVPAESGTPLTKNSAGYYAIGVSSAAKQITFVNDEGSEEEPDVSDENAVYVSTDGTINGFSGTVYTSFDTALSALGNEGGTIYIEGNVVLPSAPDTSAIEGKTLVVCGYKDMASGNVAEFFNGALSFGPTKPADIIFKNITLKRANGGTNEAWMFSYGGTVTFDESCLYLDGVRTTNSSALKMHIGAYKKGNGGKMVFSSPYVEYAEVGSIAGYYGGTTSSFTVNGDITYDLNAGIFKNVYGGMRNGTTGFATLNGDVYYNFNGATLTSSNIITGNISNGIINGNIFFTFNGGKITKGVKLGSSNVPNENYVNYGNIVLTFNGDKIALDGQEFNVTVSDGNLPAGKHGELFVIINHADEMEKGKNASVAVSSTSLDYYLRVNGGSATPVFERSESGKVGKFLGFEIKSAVDGLVPAIDGAMLTKQDGYYKITPAASEQIIEFAREDELISTITLRSSLSGQNDISTVYSNGSSYTIPECAFTPESGKIFACWTDDEGSVYYPGEILVIKDDLVLTASYTSTDKPYVFYVDPSKGSDSNDGLTLSNAFATVAKAVLAAENAGTDEGRIFINGSAAYENVPAHKKTVTYIGGALTNDTIILAGDTIFAAPAMENTKIYTAGHKVVFESGAGVVSGITLVLSHPEKESENNVAVLENGEFLQVILSESTNTKNSFIHVGKAKVKKLTLGSSSAVTENVAVSLDGNNVLAMNAGEKCASGSLFVYLSSEAKFKLSKSDFDIESFTRVKNLSDTTVSLSENGILKADADKFIYAIGQDRIFYSVGGKMSVTGAGEYEIRTALGEGIEYLPYPEIPDGKYFDKWQKISDGHLEAVFTDEKKLLSYYVSENGSDANSGTSVSSPFESLTAAVNALDGKDGRVVIMDTAYWSEDSSGSNVPAHSGTITFEGLTDSNIENQIIDYSRSTSANGTTASLRIQGNTIFKNLSFRAHHYKGMYSGGYELSFEGKIGYIPGVNANKVFNLVAGSYASSCENTYIYLGAEMNVDTFNIGHNTSSAISGKTTIVIDGANVQKLVLGGTGSKLCNVEIAYVSGNVGSLITSTSTASVSGDIKLIKGNGSSLSISNDAGITLSGNTYEYVCESGVWLRPVKGSETLFEVPDGITAVATNISTGKTYYSSKGGHINLPVGSYTVKKSGVDYYTNDGSTINVLSDCALTFDGSLYLNEKNGVFAGWCYEGSKKGPASGETLSAGTVLKASFLDYDPSGEEFGITGLQIRVADSAISQGLRFIVNRDNTFDERFDVSEYGAVILPQNYLGSAELVKGGKYVFNDKTYSSKYITAKNIFDTSDKGFRYTLCLIGIDPENYNRNYTTRAYAICTDANGNSFTVYSDPVSSSLVSVARNNEPINDVDAKAFEEIIAAWKNTVFGEGTTPFTSSHYPTAYKVNHNGVGVREITLDSGLDNKKVVQIGMITDSHLNTGIPGHTEALDKALEVANFADQIVLCGDNVESVSSSGNMALLQEHVFDAYPDAIALLGNHEYFYPGSGSMDVLKQKVDAVWPHDPDYYSRLVGEKVLVVVADDARQVTYGESVYYFTEEKVELLKADIEYARENGYVILFFCHVGLPSLDKTFMANGEIYDLITKNADVVKGCFSGHGHNDNSSSLAATYIDENGETVSTKIPYYWLRGCGEDNYQGHVLYINVK